MKFIRLLLSEAGEVRWRLVASVVLGGAAMALMMTIVNTVADLPADIADQDDSHGDRDYSLRA